VRYLSAAIFTASCLVRVVVGGIVGTLLGDLAVGRSMVAEPARLALVAAVWFVVTFGLPMAMYLRVVRPRRSNALHRLWIGLRRPR
jgi:hypothetical protein